MDSATIQSQIRTFLSKHIPNHALSNDDDIFALGLVNSLFAMQLVMFTEQTFGITVEDEDLNLDNFRTINAMTSFVERKQ